MTPQAVKKKGPFAPALRYTLGVLALLMVIALLAGAAGIPFLFESKSMWYRFGVDKTLIRTGKVLCMLAATLVMLQLVLSARLQILDRIFTLKHLNKIHRLNAAVLAICALLHPLFVFAPEDIANLSPEWKYWPEVVGATLLLSIWTTFITARWRPFLKFSFKNWWLLHRVTTAVVVVVLGVHVLFVSSTFEAGPPRIILFLALGLYTTHWLWVRYTRRSK